MADVIRYYEKSSEHQKRKKLCTDKFVGLELITTTRTCPTALLQVRSLTYPILIKMHSRSRRIYPWVVIKPLNDVEEKILMS